MTFIGFTLLFISRLKYIILALVFGILYIAIQEKWMNRPKSKHEKE